MSNVSFSTLLIMLVLLIIAGPLVTIWALNTLFPVLDIQYTFWTWLAALALGGLFSTKVSKK